MNGKRLGVGFIGTGNISSAYLKAILGKDGMPGFSVLDIKALSDMRDEAASARAAEFGLKSVSVEQMLAQWGEDQTLLGRLPTLAQVADAAVFLASEHAGAITGAVVDLTSGNAVRAQQFGRALVGVLD